MQTRRGFSYDYLNTTMATAGATCTATTATNMGGLAVDVLPSGKKNGGKRTRGGVGKDDAVLRLKRFRTSSPATTVEEEEQRHKGDFFDVVPEDIALLILSMLSSTASCPADFIRVQSTCRRLKELSLHPIVLLKASPKSLAVTATNWSEAAHRFLKQCADAGNLEACYILGMIRFYCLRNRAAGASLLAKAAMGSHAAALYSLAVIQFNGSGGSKNDKDLRAGVALCARAAYLGHIDALRELGHCLQDGYGIRQNVTEGRRFLVQANARELAGFISADAKSLLCHPHRHGARIGGCPLLSDFGCYVPQPEMHPANRFLVDWFAAQKSSGNEDEEEATGLRMCSHLGCGRPETRRHEFRRCSVCGAVNYCSRACQASDWKLRHKAECTPMELWVNDVEGGGAPVGAGMLDLNVGAGMDDRNEGKPPTRASSCPLTSFKICVQETTYLNGTGV